MRYAILSDIHSNLEALNVAFSYLTPGDGVLCLGDTIGYGPNPNECIEMIRERATATVLGNHDLAAIEDFGLSFFNPAARQALIWTQGMLTAENRDWLDTLGYDFRCGEFLMVHGAPGPNYFEYIMDEEVAARAFAATDAPLIFIGHTHIAEYYALDESGTVKRKGLQQGGEFQLAENTRYIVNVGSVGQPRDLNPNASFAFYEPDARKVTIQRFAYPIAEVQEKIVSAHLPDALARRLVLGR